MKIHSLVDPHVAQTTPQLLEAQLPNMFRGGVWPTTSPHPYMPLVFCAGPPAHHQISFCPSLKTWGQVATFYFTCWDWNPLAVSDPHNFHVRCWIPMIGPFIIMYILRKCPWTPHLPHSSNYQGNCDCFNFGILDNHSQVTTVPGSCPQAALHSHCHIFKLTPLIEVFLSNLKFGRQKLCKIYSLTLVSPSLRR